VAVVEALDTLIVFGANRRGGLTEALLLTVDAVATFSVIVDADEETILSDFTARGQGTGEVVRVAFGSTIGCGAVRC